jgi:elongator complex protein 1
LEYETCTSLARPPYDLGTVAVIDGCESRFLACDFVSFVPTGSLHLTPFRIQNIPPPMAAYTIKIPHSQRPPVHIALSSSGDSLALLWSSPIVMVEIWDLKTRRVGGRGEVMAPTLVWKESFPDQSEAWQITLSQSDEGTWVVAILCMPHSATSEACLAIATLKEGKCVDRHAIPCSPNGRLVPGDEQQLGLVLESSEGLLFRGKHPISVLCL